MLEIQYRDGTTENYVVNWTKTEGGALMLKEDNKRGVIYIPLDLIKKAVAYERHKTSGEEIEKYQDD